MQASSTQAKNSDSKASTSNRKDAQSVDSGKKALKRQLKGNTPRTDEDGAFGSKTPGAADDFAGIGA